MNPTKKVLFSFVSFFLVLVTIACSCSTLIPSGSGTPTIPLGGGSTKAATWTASVPGATATIIPSGPPFIEPVLNETNILAGESGTAIASCPSGTQMLGGGFASAAGIKITKTMPDLGGWLVTGLNSSAETLSLTSYAYCLHNDPGTTRVVSADVLVSGGPRAVCPAGEIITGGGYSFDTGTLEVYLSTPNGDSANPSNTWAVMAQNHQSQDQTIRVYAVCLASSSLTSTLVRDDKVSYVPGTDSVSVSLACPAGAVMAAGGYEGIGAYISRVNVSDSALWEVQVQGKIYFDGSLDHAVCLNLP